MRRRTPSLGAIWARKLAAVAAAFLIANAIGVAAGAVLADPVTYASREIQFVAEGIEDRSSNGCVDVIISGNSAAQYGVSPQVLEDETDLSAFSVGVQGSLASTDVRWLSEIAIPELQPSTVVWVASIASLIPKSAVEGSLVTLADRVPATSTSPGANLDRFLADYLPLVKERPAITNFGAIVDQIRGELPKNADEAIRKDPGLSVDEFGHVASERVWNPDLADLSAFADDLSRISPDWPVDTEQATEISDYLASLEDQGITTVVVVPPVTASLIELLPGGALNYSRHVDAMNQVAERSGSLLIDQSDGSFVDANFSDPFHLNSTGADMLSGVLADELRSADPSRCTAARDDG